jgi:hypothetical protein
MLSSYRSTELIFWIVIIAFYIFENIKLIDNSQILFEEWFGRFIPRYSVSTFEIQGKQVQLLNILFPLFGYIKLQSTPNILPAAHFHETKDALNTLMKNTRPQKVISVFSFCYLTTAPFFSYKYGFISTLNVIIPLHISTLICTFFCLVIYRNKIGLSKLRTAHIMFDCCIMPSALPNLVRKVYASVDLKCDGNYFAHNTAFESERELIEYSISKKIDYLYELEEVPDIERYRSYKNLLGGSNDKY